MSRSHPDNAVQKRQRRARLMHSIYSWHRWLGLSVMLWVLVFAISGLLIEAAPTLGLDKRSIQAHWIMERYGVKPPQAVQQWQLANQQVDVWDQGVSLGGEWLPQLNEFAEQITGTASAMGVLAIATEQELMLFSYGADFIDSLPSPNGKIVNLGNHSNGQLAVKTSTGVFVADQNLLAWQPSNESEIRWSQPRSNGKTETPSAKHGITWERLLLDIHSGAFFGSVGRWLSRLAAVVMILLAVSGFYTWFSRFARRPK